MNKIKDYNIELLKALHFWCWHNFLLDHEDDEYVDFGYCVRPKYSEDSTLIRLINVLKETDQEDLTYEYLQDTYGLDMRLDILNNTIWTICVEMFGAYLFDPREGHILAERRKDCADFLETIVEIEELSAAEGGIRNNE